MLRYLPSKGKCFFFFVEEKVVESLLTDLLAAIWDPGVPEQLPGEGGLSCPGCQQGASPAGAPAAWVGLGLAGPREKHAGGRSNGQHPCTVISCSESHF